MERVKPHAANYRLKTIRRLYAWTVSTERVRYNPAAGVLPVRAKSRGFVPWVLEDVKAFETRHPPGTMAWLALQLMLFSAARRSDIFAFGPLNLRGGRLHWVQAKNRRNAPNVMSIPILPPLREALEISKNILGDTTFLTNAHGKPFASAAAFGNWFRDRCDEAGLAGKSAHRVRKLVGIMAALNDATGKQIQEILGHATQAESETYVREANRFLLADAGFAKTLSEREALSFLKSLI
ncbi:MAG: tyrosine-type recombinase/integrase [Pseudomonadota bacterium]